ncbi:hypothetical protein [Microbacterium xylanilyticum]
MGSIEQLAGHGHHGGGLGDILAGWVAHAAIWDLVRHLPLPIVVVVGVVAVGVLWLRRRASRRTR